MKLNSHTEITAIGSYVPEKILTNADLERMVDTSDEWIVRRTGIRERRVSGPEQFTSDLAIEAVRNLMERYPDRGDDIDAIIVATTTPDTPFPSVASRIQQAFGFRRCLAFDLNAACAGFVAALQAASGLVESGAYRKVLVVGADTLTKLTDYSERSTCILFGDGAGAVLAERAAEGALLAASADTDGSGGIHVYASGLARTWNGQPLAGDGKIVQNGREVYKWAVQTVPCGVRALLDDAGLAADGLDWLVPHSANLRMIDAICERLGLPPERALHSVVRYGNTSSASIPLALDLAVRDGRLRPGQTAALYGFGSGLSQAGVLLRWTL